MTMNQLKGTYESSRDAYKMNMKENYISRAEKLDSEQRWSSIHKNKDHT